VLAVALVAVGLGMLVYAPATDFYAARAQARLRRQFAADVTAAAAGPTGPVPTSQALAVVRIPAIGLDAVVVQGTDPQSLRTGPGHYAQSPLPCLPGNVAVAGHRTTYGHWFNRLDELAAGDDITFVTPSGSCTYQALAAPAATPVPHAGSAAWIISPDDWGVVGPLTGSYLTLTTCNPKGSAAQRLVARARLVSAISDR
jgi:sortase A